MKPTLAPPRHSSTPTCTIRDCAPAPATEVTRLATASPARRSERRMNISGDECDASSRGAAHAPRWVYATTVPVAPDRADLKEKGPALRGPFDVTSRLRAQRRLPQKRWMRLQASSRSEVLVA